MKHIGCALAALLFLHTSRYAALAVDNRPAYADEWGYRPADGSTAVMNPPSFTWIHDKRAEHYQIEWSRTRDFAAPGTAKKVPWCVYTHHEPLEPGVWFWRYRFTTPKQEVSTWSAVRSVTIPDNAILFPMPTRAQQRERLPEKHPRLFMRPEDLPRMRAAAQDGPAAARFAALRKAADDLIKKGPTPEPAHRGSARNKDDDEAVKHWWPNRLIGDRASNEVELLAFVWLMTQDARYGEAARSFLMALAAWDPDGPSNFALNCEAGKAVLYRPARAYDWIYDILTEAERARFRAVWSRRVADAWKSGEVGHGNGHLTRPLNSHGNRIWHKIAEVAIAFYGEVPEAETWLDYAVNKFYAAYPVWADDDGGWHEGVHYLTGYMNKVTPWMQIAHSALGIDGLKKPFFNQIGNLPLYVMPPHSPNAGFGDLSYRPLSCAYLHYFARMKGADPAGAAAAANWSWWLQQTRAGTPGGVEGFLYAVNLPPLPAPVAPANRPQSMVFRGTGIVSLHATLLDSRDDVHLLFKAAPFGTSSHGHNAQLGIQLNAFGDCLLPACTYRDLHGSAFHYKWAHAARSQNTVLVNGGNPRMHSAAATGSILDARFSPEWDYVRGEATATYTGAVTRAERAVLFVKPDIVVLYDDFAAPAPATFQFMSHGLSAFTLDEAAQTLRLSQQNASLEVRYFAPQPLVFTQTDGFDPPPKMRNGRSPFPNHWHVEAATRKPATASDTLTLLLPARVGKEVPCQAERIDSPTASGLRITRGGKTLRIAFRKHGVSAAEWDGTAFDGPAFVSALVH